MRQNRIPVLKDCAVPNCPEVALTKGLCRKHYQAMKAAEKRAKQTHAPGCPALDAWDIPGACNCAWRSASV